MTQIETSRVVMIGNGDGKDVNKQSCLIVQFRQNVMQEMLLELLGMSERDSTVLLVHFSSGDEQDGDDDDVVLEKQKKIAEKSTRRDYSAMIASSLKQNKQCRRLFKNSTKTQKTKGRR